jgi:magnesium transporter
LNNLNISDVEQLIDELPEHGPRFIEILIAINRAVNVFRILDFPTQERIIKKLSGPKIARSLTSCLPMTVPRFLANCMAIPVKS